MGLETEEYSVLHAIGELEDERAAAGAHDAFSSVTEGPVTRSVETGHRSIGEVLESLTEQGYLHKEPATIMWWRENLDNLTIGWGYRLTEKGRTALRGE